MPPESFEDGALRAGSAFQVSGVFYLEGTASQRKYGADFFLSESRCLGVGPGIT